MDGAKKRCDNCWVWVEKDIETCPNCSHPFPVGEPKMEENLKVRPEPSVLTPLSMKGRPFKFIQLFLLSFIAILVFITAEGMRLNGSQNADYLLGDVIWVSLIALLMAGVLMFIDYMTSE